MRKLFLILAVVAFLVLSIDVMAATDVTLQWDANGEPDLAGYKVYRSQTSGGGFMEIAEVLAPEVQYTDQAVPDGTYYYIVTAFDDEGLESGPSNEVEGAFASGAPAAPGNLRIIMTVTVEVSP